MDTAVRLEKDPTLSRAVFKANVISVTTSRPYPP